MRAWQATVQDEAGNAVFNPHVTVYQEDGVTLADIFNEDGSSKENPFIGTTEGFAQFWAERGTYKVVGANGGISETWQVDLADKAALELAEDVAQTQARRDFAVWNLVDYLHVDDLSAAYAGDTASQDETRVTTAIQRFHDDFIDWWANSNGRIGDLVYPALPLAVNDEVFSEHFAQELWDMGWSHQDNRVNMKFNGMTLVLKNWTSRAAVRTSGFWAAQGVTDPVPKAVFRWEHSTYAPHAPRTSGEFGVIGERNQATDPIGVKIMSANNSIFNCISVYRLMNTGLMIESVFNSTFSSTDINGSGYNVTEYGGTGHIATATRFSNVGAVVTASANTFSEAHVGKWFGISGAGPNRYGYRQTFWAEIASYDSPTQITLAAVPDLDVTDRFGSFEGIRGSITGGGSVLTLTAPITDSLVGRYITVHRCGQEGVLTANGCLTARVIAHSGDQVTLSHNARITVTDAPVVIAFGMYLGRTSDAASAISINDDITFDNLRIENAFRASTSCAYISGTSIDFSPGSKFHGRPLDANNFGTNFSDITYDWATGVRLNSCIITHGGHSPRFGRHMFFGGRIETSITGDEVDQTNGNLTAAIYNDMVSSPTVGRIYYGIARSNDLVGTQVVARYGQYGLASQVMGANSSRAAKQGAGRSELPTFIDGLHLDGALTGPAFGTTGAEGEIVRSGYDGKTGAVLTPWVPDLNAITNMHRRVRWNASTANTPWAGTGGFVDVFYHPDYVYQIAYMAVSGGYRRVAVRHNWTPNSAWIRWTSMDVGNGGSTANRLPTPLLYETYFDTTLGRPIWWNGTAWVDATGTTV